MLIRVAIMLTAQQLDISRRVARRYDMIDYADDIFSDGHRAVARDDASGIRAGRRQRQAQLRHDGWRAGNIIWRR